MIMKENTRFKKKYVYLYFIYCLKKIMFTRRLGAGVKEVCVPGL